MVSIPGEIDHALNLSKSKIVFASTNTIDKVLSVTRKHSSVQTVVVFGQKTGDDAEVIDFSTFCYAYKSKEVFECEPQDVMDNVSMILCSSGTTGLPKGVMITQHNVMVGIYQH